MRKRLRFYNSKRPKLRQSWNKYNIFNFHRYETPKLRTLTFFQQKWLAKASSRAYHGETVREKQWQMMFRRSIRSVVSMDPSQLARTDGSEWARGRGSGYERIPTKEPRVIPKTPYMNMVYAPLERRLDTAIFRAMFASSTRQARQFVVHGDVKVNGKTMIYPGYQLNPGDMFQVEPERVLYATGAPKDRNESRSTRKMRRKSVASTADSPSASESPSPSSESPSSESPSSESHSSESLSSDSTSSTSESTSLTSESAASSSPPKPTIDTQEILSSLISSAKTILATPSAKLHAKRKDELRSFMQKVRRTLNRPLTTSEPIEDQLLELSAKLRIPPLSDSYPTSPPLVLETAAANALSKPDATLLREAMVSARENPIDLSKPYGTPWRPREYMSAFALIPRYLEVHHRICSAVYIRHPVARPGMAEVPTPFQTEMNGLTYLWYLRRR